MSTSDSPEARDFKRDTFTDIVVASQSGADRSGTTSGPVPADEASAYETPAEVGISALAVRTVTVHFGEPPISAWVGASRLPLPATLGQPRQTQ